MIREEIELTSLNVLKNRTPVLKSKRKPLVKKCSETVETKLERIRNAWINKNKKSIA